MDKNMRVKFLGCAALAALMLPAVAHADDPHDVTMRSKAARDRDRAIIRRLNLDEAARVKARDARYAEGWRAYREYAAAGHDRRYDADRAEYDRKREQYERDMADWRRAVAACRAGDWSACD